MIFLFRSPVNARGVFKIPNLSRRHFDISVYSQLPNMNDCDNYQEVSVQTGCIKY